MRNVYALHEEVAVANACLTVSEGCAVDNNILAEDVLITDYETCVVALIVEILRLSTEHSVLEHLVSTTQARALHNAHIRIDYTVIANDNIVFDVDKGINRDVLSKLCSRSYVCFIANHNFMF